MHKLKQGCQVFNNFIAQSISKMPIQEIVIVGYNKHILKIKNNYSP